MRGLVLILLLLSGCAAIEKEPQKPATQAASSAYSLPRDQTLTRIAFGSCLAETRPQPILKQVAAANPDLFIFMGDNVYADHYWGRWLKAPNKDAINHAYELQSRNPEFKEFIAQQIPLLATWDDHDYGLNDAGGELPLAYKKLAKTALLDFFAVPGDAPVRKRAGLYQSLTFGPDGRRVQIILLDTRWFRSPLTKTDQRGAKGKERYLQDWDADKTMLGDAQWRWLAAELRKPADLRLIVTSIQLMAEAHGYERWGNLPLERDRLYELVVETGADNVVLLSGDRHVGGFYHRILTPDLAIYEATSSSLNRSFTHWSDERGPFQMGPMVGPANFGVIDIDWAAQSFGIKLVGEDGETLRRIAVEHPKRRHPSS
jgi:alkaline phosphatase D